jgi:hypothetical protein
LIEQLQDISMVEALVKKAGLQRSGGDGGFESEEHGWPGELDPFINKGCKSDSTPYNLVNIFFSITIFDSFSYLELVLPMADPTSSLWSISAG